MNIEESKFLGLDLGIGSIGWGVLDFSAPMGDLKADGEIVGVGSCCFDVPETDKERTPTNQIRRAGRLMRRVLHRRALRKRDVRALCRRYGLLDDISPDDLNRKQLNPWKLRAEGLERRLTGEELAVVMIHIAKHRGFKSNSKRDRGANKAGETGKMLAAIERTQEKLSHYRSVGQMLAQDPEYAGRKRNRDQTFDRSILRSDQEAEIRLLFDCQRRSGNPAAGEELLQAYADIAFSQRPIKSSEHMVGDCPFIAGERRAALHAPSFERFRLLTRLVNLRISDGRAERKLEAAEIRAAEQGLGEQKGLSFKKLRGLLGLADHQRFVGVKPEEEKHDVAARSGSALPGTAALRGCLAEKIGKIAWAKLAADGAMLDEIAFVLAFRDDKEEIHKGLAAHSLPDDVFDALTAGVESGAFADFKKAASLSAAACRRLIPHLRAGMNYTQACAAEGWDHARQPRVSLQDIKNPIARKAITEALKQVRAVVKEHGLPGRMHVELARDLGKSAEERGKLEKGIKDRTAAKDKLRDEYAEHFGARPNGEDLLRYELWKEQNGRSLYSDTEIPLNSVVSGHNDVQVDHILPWSRFGDDSFINKTLCFAHENQQKKGRTPYEWLGDDEKKWAPFAARVESVKGMKGRKKRNYLLKNAKEREESFRERNLNDTRYASRMLMALLKQEFYPKERHGQAGSTLRVTARPGALTDLLRRGWGLQNIKKTADGERKSDDRHHALDALITAAAGDAALNQLTRRCQQAEAIGLPRDFGALPLPWPNFAEQVRKAVENVFVVRAERRRARGEGHAATIRQVKEIEGEHVVFERKPVDKLTEKDLANIKDADRNHKLVESLREWIADGKPKDRRPMSPQGHPIAKVRLRTTTKPAVSVRGGAADRGEMTRVDVFRKAKPKGGWEWFLVPVYPHQVMDKKSFPNPPNQAIQAYEDESRWPEMTEAYEFVFSLHPFSYVVVEKGGGKAGQGPIAGYFRGAHRGTGAITVSHPRSNLEQIAGIGARTLKSIRKFRVDRFGNLHEVKQEQRTWHGAACT
jgi:CRISPR-associated endonuclease Csn1